MTPAELKALRTAKKFSQEALARLLNVAVNTVSRWECGKRKVPHWVPTVLFANPLFAPKNFHKNK